MSGVRPPSPVMRYHVRPRGRSRKPSTARAYEKSPWYPVPAALLAQLVEHLHGKEGVDGSSPSEGLHKFPAIQHVVLPETAKGGRSAGTRRVHFGTGGHSRARLTSGGSDQSNRSDAEGRRDRVAEPADLVRSSSWISRSGSIRRPAGSPS